MFAQRLFRPRSKKTSELRVLAFVRVENSPVTGEFPAQRASNTEKGFHLMTSSLFIICFNHEMALIVLRKTHVCWWPSDTKSQVISSCDIDPYIAEFPIFGTAGMKCHFVNQWNSIFILKLPPPPPPPLPRRLSSDSQQFSPSGEQPEHRKLAHEL